MSRFKDRKEIGLLGETVRTTQYRPESSSSPLTLGRTRREFWPFKRKEPTYWTGQYPDEEHTTGYIFDSEDAAKRHVLNHNLLARPDHRVNLHKMEKGEEYVTMDKNRWYKHRDNDGLGEAERDIQPEYEEEERQRKKDEKKKKPWSQVHQEQREERRRESARWEPWRFNEDE